MKNKLMLFEEWIDKLNETLMPMEKFNLKEFKEECEKMVEEWVKDKNFKYEWKEQKTDFYLKLRTRETTGLYLHNGIIGADSAQYDFRKYYFVDIIVDYDKFIENYRNNKEEFLIILMSIIGHELIHNRQNIHQYNNPSWNNKLIGKNNGEKIDIYNKAIYKLVELLEKIKKNNPKKYKHEYFKHYIGSDQEIEPWAWTLVFPIVMFFGKDKAKEIISGSKEGLEIIRIEMKKDGTNWIRKYVTAFELVSECLGEEERKKFRKRCYGYWEILEIS